MWRYLGIIGGFVAILLLAAGSLWLAWPWVLSENMRLTPVELALTWLAEVGALVWFLYFMVKFIVTSELDSAFEDSIAHAPGTQAIALLVVLAAGLDLGATFFFQARDEARRQTASEGVCRVNQVKLYSVDPVKDTNGNIVSNSFCALTWCDVIDAEDEAHPTYFYGTSRRFPKSVHDKIIRKRVPIDMDIVYDPEFPRRFWFPDQEDDYLSVWRLSLEITVFALVFTLLVLITNKTLFSTAIPLEICPLVGITIRLGMAAVYMIVNGQTSFWPF